MSCTPLSGETALAPALDNFAQAAILAAEWGTISVARQVAHKYSDATFRDLGTFLKTVSTIAVNSNLRSAASAAYSQYLSTILANYSGRLERATGLSIYLPAPGSTLRSDYTASNYLFCQDTHWDEFLQAYVSHGPRQPGDAATPASNPPGHRTPGAGPSAGQIVDVQAAAAKRETPPWAVDNADAAVQYVD